MVNLNLSGAVKEIVGAILDINPLGADGELHLQIKSSKKNITSRSEAHWYYIKVSTSASITTETFSGFNLDSSLYKVLRAMHEVEEESHLCLQCPQKEDSVQYNLVLNGQILEVQHETTKTKQNNLAVLYLRLHQQFMHVMDESKLMHDYLLLLKVFRPQFSGKFGMKYLSTKGSIGNETKSGTAYLLTSFQNDIFQWNITFNIKLGDVKSRDKFRANDWRIASDSLPPIVTDPEFFLSKSDILPVGCCTAVSFSYPLNTGMTDQLSLSAVGCIIPVDKRRTKNCIFTLNFYSPNFAPLDIQTEEVIALLELVNWEQFGLKLSTTAKEMESKFSFPCQEKISLEPNKRSSIDPCIIAISLVVHPGIHSSICTPSCDYLSTYLQNKQTCVQCIESFVQKALQPLKEKVKVREITHKSIMSVCKAVTDIVTLSDNGDFRNKMLSCMKVNDKVDLGKELERKLMTISRGRHPSVWAGWEDTDIGMVLPKPIHQYDRQSQDYGEPTLQPEHRIIQEKSLCSDYSLLDSGLINSIIHNQENDDDDESTLLVPISPFQKLVDSDTESDTKYLDQNLINAESTSKVVENDKTPEIINLTEKMQEVSPFRELAGAEFLDNSVQFSLSEDPHHSACVNEKGDGNVEMGNKLTATTSVESNKVLSAYENHRHLEPSCTQPPIGVFNIVRDNNNGDFDNLQKEIAPHFVMHDKEVITTVQCDNYEDFDALQDETDPGIVHIPVKESSFRQDPISPSKFIEDLSDSELMKHEDFPATLQVVSDFIDKTANNILTLKDIPVGASKIFEKSSNDIQGKEKKNDLDPSKANDGHLEPDSDDWFDDVLMDVEDWLN